MSEFVGRTGSHRVYSYPERRGGIGPTLFARNFAVGVGDIAGVVIPEDPGIQVPWSTLESGAPGVNVPITPRSTGIIRISGVIVVKSASETPENIDLTVEVNGVTQAIPFLESNTVDAGGFEAIPFLSELIAALPIGVTANIQIRLISSTADVIRIRPGSSTIDVQEVPPATG